MPIVVLVIALVAYAYAMIALPSVRRPGLALGAALGLGLSLYFWHDDAETQDAASRITPDELVLDELVVERTIRGAALSGRVLNRSERYRLRDMTLTLRLRDCGAAGRTLADCPIAAESTAIARPDAPPGQLRSFFARFIFDALPPPAEEQRWDWAITAIRATP